ncbi:MAG: helix-turn-helix transcriptional regulator [Halohasta sp.]
MSNTTKVESARFLTQSSARVRLLELLYEDGPLRKRELRDAVDASRVTVRRNVNALEDHDLIAVSGRRCELTALGEIIVEDVLPALETADLVDRLRPFVRWVPDGELDFDLRALGDAHIVVSTPTDPYGPIDRHIAAIETADWCRLLLPAIGIQPMTVARDRLVDDESVHELVVSEAVAATLRTRPTYRTLIEEMVDSGNYDLYCTDHGVPFYLGVFEELIQIGVTDDDGQPRALAETNASEIREWAERTYDEYLSHADPCGYDI